jgi:CPA2 family monovalent cation:H+ antiporter-2
LDQQGIPHVVIEHGRDMVQQLRDRGVAAVSGDATETKVLTQAHITNASMLVLATKDTIDTGKIIKAARRLNPTIRTVLRSHNEEEVRLFEQQGMGTVFIGEQELAEGMSRHILARFAVPTA